MRLDARAMLAVMFLLAGLNGAAFADDVVLRSATRLDAGTTAVTLADIAELSGEHAQSLAGVVVLELSGPPRVLELSVQEVRQALEAAGVHWGRINLQGSRVVLRPSATSTGNAPAPMQPISLVTTPQEHRTRGSDVEYRLVSELAREHTVRGAISRYIAGGLQVPADSVKLAFDARDAATLDVTSAQFRIEVEAVSSLRSDRIQMVARLWDGMRIAQNATLTVLPLVRTPVVVAERELSEGTKLLPSDVSTEEMWVSPSRSGWFTSTTDVADKVLDRSVHAGERLVSKHLRKHIIIERGHRAIVRCLVGGIVISLEAECRQAGAEGESVEFRKLGERETFFATITAPGEAVMDLSTH